MPPGYCGFIGIGDGSATCALFFAHDKIKYEYLGASRGPSINAIAQEIAKAIPGSYVRFLVPDGKEAKGSGFEVQGYPKSHPVMTMVYRWAQAGLEDFNRLQKDTKSVSTVLSLLI